MCACIHRESLAESSDKPSAPRGSQSAASRRALRCKERGGAGPGRVTHPPLFAEVKVAWRWLLPQTQGGGARWGGGGAPPSTTRLLSYKESWADAAQMTPTPPRPPSPTQTASHAQLGSCLQFCCFLAGTAVGKSLEQSIGLSL